MTCEPATREPTETCPAGLPQPPLEETRDEDRDGPAMGLRGHPHPRRRIAGRGAGGLQPPSRKHEALLRRRTVGDVRRHRPRHYRRRPAHPPTLATVTLADPR